MTSLKNKYILHTYFIIIHNPHGFFSNYTLHSSLLIMWGCARPPCWCSEMTAAKDLETGMCCGDIGEILMVGALGALSTESANSAWSMTRVTVIRRWWGTSSSKSRELSSVMSSSISWSWRCRWWWWRWWSCSWLGFPCLGDPWEGSLPGEPTPFTWLMVTPFWVDTIISFEASTEVMVASEMVKSWKLIYIKEKFLLIGRLYWELACSLF